LVITIREQDAEVLDQHGGHVSFDAGNVQFLGNLMDDGCLTTPRTTLYADSTLKGEQGFDGVFD
jgi:hypothetical protein